MNATEAAMGVRWDCVTDGDSYPATLSRILNPITRSVVSIEPPVEIGSEAELDAICNRFYAYCKIAWDPMPGENPGSVRLDPETIGAAWLRRMPPPGT